MDKNTGQFPEGLKWLLEVWPRYEDGRPVRFSDDFDRDGDEYNVVAVTVYRNGNFALNFLAYSKGERVKRPVPKVLDADGVEIREGDTVYQMGCKYRVSHLHGANGKVRIVYENSGRWVDPKTLTHRAPVLAADRRPLRDGQTVYHIADGKEYTVEKLFEDGAMVTHDGITGERCRAEYLTHERPDSWARWIEDAGKSTCEYFGSFGTSCDGCQHDPYMCDNDRNKDLVRRAKKLTGVSE